MKRIACFAVLACLGGLARPIHAQQPAEGSVIITFEPKKDDVVRPVDVVKDSSKLAVPQLKVRLDSAVSGVAIRPTAEGRIEIVVPPKMKGKDLTAADVQRIKELVGAVGHLEFLMLANTHDEYTRLLELQCWHIPK